MENNEINEENKENNVVKGPFGGPVRPTSEHLELIQSFNDDIMAVLEKYDGKMPRYAVLGIFESIKALVVDCSMPDEEDYV